MTVQEIAKVLDMKVLCGEEHIDRTVVSGYCCDLLSRVMANGKKDGLWITVQAHMNIVAIASLHDMACIVVPESIEVPESTLSKAEEEQVIILSSDQDAFTLAQKLSALLP